MRHSETKSSGVSIYSSKYNKRSAMITIRCPECGNSFRDYQGENAILNGDGEMIDYDRYYQCPYCYSEIDIQEGICVNVSGNNIG